MRSFRLAASISSHAARLTRPFPLSVVRAYSQHSQQQQQQVPRVFDRAVKTAQRNRAAANVEASREVDYLRDTAAEYVVDRLLDIRRNFPVLVDIGAGAGHIVKFLPSDKCDHLIMTDTAEKMLYRDVDRQYKVRSVERRVVDEEHLPFKENSLDGIVSSLSLHWVNDLLGTLIQARMALKPDGLFMASLIGGDSLFELRTSFQLAEMEREGGLSPRVSPMADIRDMGNILSRAGFVMTTVDVDEVTIDYPTPFHVMADLRAMGETNAVHARRPFLRRDTLTAAAAIYQTMHGNDDGTVPATFQIIHLIGWKPDANQPKPLERGTAKHSLKDVLEK